MKHKPIFLIGWGGSLPTLSFLLSVDAPRVFGCSASYSLPLRRIIAAGLAVVVAKLSKTIKKGVKPAFSVLFGVFGLESVRTLKRTKGSNPFLSAKRYPTEHLICSVGYFSIVFRLKIRYKVLSQRSK